MNEEWIKWLDDRAACKEGVEWVQSFPTVEEAWEKCERADWMLWFIRSAYPHYLPGGEETEERAVSVELECIQLVAERLKVADPIKQAIPMLAPVCETDEEVALQMQILMRYLRDAPDAQGMQRKERQVLYAAASIWERAGLTVLYYGDYFFDKDDVLHGLGDIVRSRFPSPKFIQVPPIE